MSMLRRLYKGKKDTDFEKIKVSSNGDFSMSSKDIFDDKDESLRLIKKLKGSVNSYKLSNPLSNPLNQSSNKRRLVR